MAELADARDLKLARVVDHNRSHVDFTNEFPRALKIVRRFAGPNWRAVARGWPARPQVAPDQGADRLDGFDLTPRRLM